MPWFLALTKKSDAVEQRQEPILSLGIDVKGWRSERVLLDCCAAGSLCPPRLARKEIDDGKRSIYRSATGEEVTTLGEQLMSLRTEAEGEIIMHRFEVSKTVYCPDALIMSARHVTKSGNRIVLSDNGGSIENDAAGQRIGLSKVGNIFDFRAYV